MIPLLSFARSRGALLLVVLLLLVPTLGCATTSNRPGAPEITGRPITSIETVVADVGGRVDWSHENGMIAYSKQGDDGRFDLWIASDASFSDERCLTCDTDQVADLNNDQPAWHPGGAWIVFQSQDPTLEIPPRFRRQESRITHGGSGINNNLWVVNRDGTQFYQLTAIRSMEATLHAHFSHDGRKLLWAAIEQTPQRGGRWVMRLADFVVDSDGIPSLSNIQTLEPNRDRTTFYETHGFTPDDSEIIYSANTGREVEYDLDIWKLTLATGTTTQLTDSPQVWDEHGQISPSGRHIVWISSNGYEVDAANWTRSSQWARSLVTDLWMMEPDGEDQQQITFFNREGHPEHGGQRLIPADSSWNGEGTQLLLTVGAPTDGLRGLLQGEGGWRSHILLLTFDGPR